MQSATVSQRFLNERGIGFGSVCCREFSCTPSIRNGRTVHGVSRSVTAAKLGGATTSGCPAARTLPGRDAVPDHRGHSDGGETEQRARQCEDERGQRRGSADGTG